MSIIDPELKPSELQTTDDSMEARLAAAQSDAADMGEPLPTLAESGEEPGTHPLQEELFSAVAEALAEADDEGTEEEEESVDEAAEPMTPLQAKLAAKGGKLGPEKEVILQPQAAPARDEPTSETLEAQALLAEAKAQLAKAQAQLAQAQVQTAEAEAPEPAAVETPTQEDPQPAPEPEQDSGPFSRIPKALRKAIESKGYDSLTSVQEAVLEAGDRDLQISSQTGSGKTVAIGLVLAPKLLTDDLSGGRPIGPKVLVLTPTRELAMQVKGELEWLYGGVRGVTVDCVTGGTSVGFERRRLERPASILVGTPGRVLDHLSSKSLNFSELESVVLDEADQMLDMGFRDELEGILEKMPEERRMHLVSATFPDGIQRLARNYQHNPQRIEGTALGQANADIEHVVHLVQDLDRRAAMINLLLLTGKERTLVFVKQRAESNHVAEMLSKEGFPALPLSGELVQAQRTRTLEAFKNGRVNVLVATDVAARGLDVPAVTTVIHTAPPIDSESYVHRSGRTGRAGRKGKSILLAPPMRARKVEWLLRDAGVEFRFDPVPSAKQVEQILCKREAAQLAALLDESEVTDELRTQAEELLEGRSAADVVAALLKKAAPDRPAEPQHLERHSPPAKRRPEGKFAKQISDRNARADRGRRDFTPGGSSRNERSDRNDYNDRPDRARGVKAPQASGDFVRFTINWGFESGANPRRLLAMACRRGGITNHDVGSIGVDPRSSTIDVASRAAADFQTRASRRDSRDKNLVIERA